MQDDILRLIELQKLDLEILRLEKAMCEIPEVLRKIKEQREKLQERLSQTVALMEEKESQRRLFEEELKEELKRLKQTQARLMQIRGTREYQILLAEIEEIKRTNKQKEDEILRLMEEIEKLKADKSKVEEELENVSKVFEEEDRRFKEFCQRLNDEKRQLLERRGQLATKVSSRVLNKYELIRQKKAGVGIAPVEQGVCKGCNMAIPPQLYIEIQKDNRYYECPHCKRLIYFKRYYEGEDSETQNLKEAKVFK